MTDPRPSASPATTPPWYAEGLRFRCTQCGKCCTGEPGHVWVDDEEIRRLARARGLSPRAFKARFVRRVGKRWSLREKENGDCVLLKDGLCTVYDSKPTRCTTFPFWGPVLESPATWAETAERCEGIGQGDVYDLEAIERLRAGDPRPLVERHARPPEQPVRHRDDPADKPAEVPGEAVAPEVDWAAAFTALERVYADLDAELPRTGLTCAASGRCCDFDVYGHRLYVTTLEAMWFFTCLEGRRNDDARACPAWGTDRLCHERRGRMLGCRTYFCGPYAGVTPEDVHPRYHARVQALHERFGIPYAYRDIRAWAEEMRPAGGDGAP
ncbi:MAG: YkgJ family cysteine cluster protein [Planctomycetota bacterium]